MRVSKRGPKAPFLQESTKEGLGAVSEGQKGQQLAYDGQISQSHSQSLPNKPPNTFVSPENSQQPPTAAPIRYDNREQNLEQRNTTPSASLGNPRASVASSPPRKNDTAPHKHNQVRPEMGNPPSFRPGSDSNGTSQHTHHSRETSLSNRYSGTEQYSPQSRPLSRYNKPYKQFNRRYSQRNDARLAPFAGDPTSNAVPFVKPFRRPSENWTHVPNGPSNSSVPPCPNKFGGHFYNYIACDCKACNGRNRSVWVRVKDAPEEAAMETQTRLKFGMESRFGKVEDVFPGSSSRDMAFIVK